MVRFECPIWCCEPSVRSCGALCSAFSDISIKQTLPGRRQKAIMASKMSDSPSPAMLSNIWENLNDLSVKDPEAYNKISVEAAKHFAVSCWPPLPFDIDQTNIAV